jgi:hypothetical protein
MTEWRGSWPYGFEDDLTMDGRANYCLDTILQVHTIIPTLNAILVFQRAFNADKNDGVNSQVPPGP